eukprot:8711-Hanusia_phi.AAC.1
MIVSPSGVFSTPLIDQVNSTRVDCDYPCSPISVEAGTAGDAVGTESGCGTIVELMGTTMSFSM